MKKVLASLVPWIVCLIVLVLDQVTKSIVLANMKLHQSIPVIGDLLRWSYIQNDGMAFGLSYLGGRTLGFISLAASILFAFLLYRLKNEPVVIRTILGAIIGGAIGNTIDRLRFGFVVDFIDVDTPDALMPRWHVFNIADAAVSTGVVILILFSLYRSYYDSRNRSEEPGDQSVNPGEIKDPSIEDVPQSKPDEVVSNEDSGRVSTE